MGKAMKILLTAALIIGITFFTLGVISAKEHGLTILELGSTLRSNLEELNIRPGYAEFSSIQEEVDIGEDDSRQIIITNTFPNLRLQEGVELRVELYGNVSSRLKSLVSWKRDGDTLTIDFASVFNENPTSTGLEAVLTLPRDLGSLKITSISGDVALIGVTSEKVDIEIKSGNLQVVDAEIEELRALIQSGNLSLDTWSRPFVTIKTISGNIHTESGGLAGSLKSSSGNIYAAITEAQSGDLAVTTESGNIHLVHEGWDYKYRLSSETGLIEIQGDGEGENFGTAGDPRHSLELSTLEGNVLFVQAPE